MRTVGVVVGRFQVDAPHEGHRRLLEEVRKRHGKVLICLGCAPVCLAQEDPLDYPTRERMMRKAFPWATVMPIYDQPADEYWSAKLDELITQTFPTDSAILYGSRKSFLPRYKGKWPIKEIDAIDVPSGKDLRLRLASEVRDSEDFRAGVIYACSNRYPVVYPTIDVAIIRNARHSGNSNSDSTEVLLCGKKNSPKFFFIGGFISPEDQNMETAARREVDEETGIEIGQLRYVGTWRVNDWRYIGREDAVMTTFFVAEYIFGAPRPGDDVDSLEWVSIRRLQDKIGPQHSMLATHLESYLNAERKKTKNLKNKAKNLKGGEDEYKNSIQDLVGQ